MWAHIPCHFLAFLVFSCHVDGPFLGPSIAIYNIYITHFRRWSPKEMSDLCIRIEDTLGTGGWEYFYGNRSHQKGTSYARIRIAVPYSE